MFPGTSDVCACLLPLQVPSVRFQTARIKTQNSSVKPGKRRGREVQVRRFSGYEWLLSNLQGAYALGPANLLNHRKYHGLLVSSTEDLKRTHLVSSIEEKVEAGREISFFIDSNSYPNLVYPQGYKHLLRYFFRPHPVFFYSSIPSSYEILILKSIQLHPSLNFSVVRYKNMGKILLSLRIRPKFTLRDHHTVNRPGYWDLHEHVSESWGDTGKVAGNGHQVFLFSSNADILLNPIIYRDVTYPTEIGGRDPGLRRQRWRFCQDCPGSERAIRLISSSSRPPSCF